MFRLRRQLLLLSAAAATCVAVACRPSSDIAITPDVQLVHASGTSSWVAVGGLPVGDLDALGAVTDDDTWRAILRVSVSADAPAVVGRYTIEDGALRFTPQFPFDPGRTYVVRFDPAKLPRSARRSDPWRSQVVTTTVSMPSRAGLASTHVRRIFPSADAWPANQLRVYVDFSAPMSGKGGIEHLHLLDETGTEIADPFLPLDYDFWNVDRTRFTAFFDPGRVKSGLVPRNEMGPALQPGRTYTLVVDREWRDAWGQPLSDAFRREFRTVAPDLTPIDMAAWKVTLPKAGTTGAVRVEFGEPLDRALMLRSLAVRAPNRQIVPGDAHAGEGDRSWSFEPEEPWPAGRYELVALSILEDLAGNQIGRAFEVDAFTKVENPEPTTAARPILIR
ncbi:MAG: hypothetical protein AB7L71_15940 [Vicinamibacterales bacterium]